MQAANDIETQAKTQPGLFSQIEQKGHEQVVYFYDEPTGLKCIIAIHNTVLGPALGGTRMWPYKTEAEALQDVLRLSRGMTYKSSISGINLGGGKAVIIGDPATDKSESFWRRYGRFIDRLGGFYITAEDVGTSTADMEYVQMETDFCTGIPEYLGGGGDPSPVTAYGTYLGMKAAAKEAWGNESLEGKQILVQGAGHVGFYLVELLAKEQAQIMVADINAANLEKVSQSFKVKVIDPDEVYATEMDIYAPCALGAVLNDKTIPMLKCQIIAGASNNQLADETRHSNMLLERNILYAPDFLINAGGVINCYTEMGGYDRDKAYAFTEKIYDRTLEIFQKAKASGISSHEAATQLAAERIERMMKVNTKN